MIQYEYCGRGGGCGGEVGWGMGLVFSPVLFEPGQRTTKRGVRDHFTCQCHIHHSIIVIAPTRRPLVTVHYPGSV